MEETRGVTRGSYIWGRSVHNIRIEKLWRDLTLGFGAKWKSFFQTLEMHDGLDVDSDAHIWLLHVLFLSDINIDALNWANAWNNHIMSIRNERQRSPRDMFVFGIIQNGVRGMIDNNNDLDLDSFGIDWDDYDDPTVLAHHTVHNPPDSHDNPFITH
ncbi:hypothetical protein H0H81_003004 [Sphagnurus paluster]|uniref:Integrase core domain-containing protein n=1 Tax=Sphagnurus paluster TaxID=117069 RepID=A0A9P7GH77_9AGAR|nr:hypothetical protein H0H81_003004 [Sphagnurus paluster]